MLPLVLLVAVAPAASAAAGRPPLSFMAVQEVVLDGSNWTLANANGSLVVNGTAIVPSSVPDVLAAHGLVFDARGPRYGYENDKLLDLMTSDNFTYSLQASQQASRRASERASIALHCALRPTRTGGFCLAC
jgi:hypothetical protein